MVGQVMIATTKSVQNIGLEKQQKPLLIMRFILSNFRIM